uniref:NADH-ubiquinone oxidoreductase chain 6 n=1 Tax=Xyronotus aztecus TaxID=62797 RepID=A0A7G8LS23_9ORTH|nr:NADH dehydrogenase subunit 6 [Xyronotus aztecus]
MINSIIMTLSLLMNLNFIQLIHPMSLMMFIIIQTFIVCLISGMMMESYWLSYILFLTFLGGMLVLFIYITSIASNEMFYLSSSSMIKSMIISIFIISTIYMIDKLMILNYYNNNDFNKSSSLITIQEMSLTLSKVYNNPTYFITLMMMIYLFITLLAVVKITNINQGPLRKQN